MPGKPLSCFGCAITNHFKHLVHDGSSDKKAVAIAKQSPRDKKAPLPSPATELEQPSHLVTAGLRREGWSTYLPVVGPAHLCASTGVPFGSDSRVWAWHLLRESPLAVIWLSS
uniref:Uncharacterized protein n=1 Tax=Eptatretus burgeri TaxID=7764 RepID=A0A8C4QN61_EPTBU